MENTDNICPSQEEIKEMNAAFYHKGKFVWKSELFLKMEKQLGEDLILDAVKMHKFPVRETNDKEIIYRYTVTPAEDHDVLIFSVDKVRSRLKSKDTVDVMIKNIKDNVTNVSTQIEAIENILAENGVHIDELDQMLKYVSKTNMSMWFKTMFTDLVREYEQRMDLLSDQERGCVDAAFIAKVFEKHLNESLTGIVKTVDVNSEDEILVRYINSNHLRIILALGVRKILSMNLKTEFINVNAAKNDNGTASITVVGGSMQKTPPDPEMLNMLQNMDEMLKALPVEEFIKLFRQKYNCKIKSGDTEDGYFVKIIMPAYNGVITQEDRASLIAAKTKSMIFLGSFVPETMFLCDAAECMKKNQAEKKPEKKKPGRKKSFK